MDLISMIKIINLHVQIQMKKKKQREPK